MIADALAVSFRVLMLLFAAAYIAIYITSEVRVHRARKRGHRLR